MITYARQQAAKTPAPGDCALCCSPARLGTVAVAWTHKRVCEACRDEFISLYHIAATVIA